MAPLSLCSERPTCALFWTDSTAHRVFVNTSSSANKMEAPCAVSASANVTFPQVNGVNTFIGGKLKNWEGEVVDVESPVFSEETGKKIVIGQLSQMGEKDALEALDAAVAAWDQGQGQWPQMSLASRIAAIEAFVTEMRSSRDEIVNILMWEICKTTADAAKEFDRTMDFIASTISTLHSQVEDGLGQWTTASGVTAKVRRGPIGVSLMLAPFNYPLNEMYAMLIPALLMGNIVVMKLPNCGGLAHVPTAAAFAKTLPPGVVNFLTGRGRVTCTPIMKSGKVDVLGFIGGAKAADALIAAHPRPHRLKIFSQLEGKNIGMVMPDADVEVAASQCKDGSTSYNGQRCTAVKLIMVHESIADSFISTLVAKINALKCGLPWVEGTNITPLPEPNKPAYLKELIEDATAKGAKVINDETAGGKGGVLAGCLFHPAVVYPVTPEMRLFHEEQFGPVIPIATYKDSSELITAAKASWNGQQAAIFSSDPTGAATAPIVDALSTIVGRININVQCSRSPDVFPFSGRRSSAMGTMSVSEALKSFSVETVVAFKESNATSKAVVTGLEASSKFLAPVTDSGTINMVA